MTIKLNNAQKQFLFDNCYVTAKVLDACTENGWQKYFMKNFVWELQDTKLMENGTQYIATLTLTNKELNEVWYRMELYIWDDDYFELTSL